MRARSARVLLVVSLTVLLGTPVAVMATRPSPDVGSLAALTDPLGSGLPAAGSARSSLATVSWDRGGDVVESGSIPVPRIAVHPSRLQDLGLPEELPRPVRVIIPSIHVDAPIVSVGVAEANTMQVPVDVSLVGWYRFGPSPGQPGSAILAGHVDSRVQGRGVFFLLGELVPGETLVIRYSDGGRTAFRVVARRSYAKDALPDLIFRRSGRPTLTLLTCGGPFDPIRRHYADNVVVFAVPVAS